MVKKFVYAEPELWQLLHRMSKIQGTLRKDSGSMSEAFRKFCKTGMITLKPNLKNVEGINWDEMYI